MEKRIFVLSGLLEDANGLPVSYTDVFDTEEAAKSAMNNWRERLLEKGDTTIKTAEESFDDDDRMAVKEYLREWTMEWDSPTYELHFSQVIHEFVKVDGSFKQVSHARLRQGVNLRSADLCGVNLQDEDLNNAKLYREYLYCTKSYSTNLHSTDLRNADLIWCRSAWYDL